MRYFSFVHPGTGEYVEIEIRISDKLPLNRGVWCGNKVLVSHDLFRCFPAGDNNAVREWFTCLSKIEPPEFLQLEM